VEKTGGTNNVDSDSTHDLMENIQRNADRLVEENRQIREGLSALVDVAITKVSSIKLIRRAQEKVRSLEALANESRNEVTSLRQRVDLLQKELELKRDEHHRQNAANQHKIADLQETLRQLKQQLSWLTDQGKASETELQQCRTKLAKKNASLENAVAAGRQAMETLALREVEFQGNSNKPVTNQNGPSSN
jgi:chromosome segregation ATPase